MPWDDLELNYQNAMPLEGRRWACYGREEKLNSLKDSTQGMQNSREEQDGGIKRYIMRYPGLIKCDVHTHCLETLLKCSFDSEDLRWVQRFYISNKLPSSLDTVGPATPL